MALIFFIAYLISGTFVNVLELALAVCVQSWCLDYKQNVLDQGLSDEDLWMMAAEEGVTEGAPPPLDSLASFLVEQLDIAQSTAKEAARSEPAVKAGGASKTGDKESTAKGAKGSARSPKLGKSPSKGSGASPKRPRKFQLSEADTPEAEDEAAPKESTAEGARTKKSVKNGSSRSSEKHAGEGAASADQGNEPTTATGVNRRRRNNTADTAAGAASSSVDEKTSSGTNPRRRRNLADSTECGKATSAAHSEEVDPEAAKTATQGRRRRQVPQDAT